MEAAGARMTGTDETREPGGASTSVFVSYAHEDVKQARTIIDVLERAGYRVWWDGLIEGGERFSRKTEDALDSAKAVVVLWSKASLASHWVRDEATYGRDRSRLVPLSIDGTEPPIGFRQFQYIDASRPKVKPGSPEMQSLLRAVAALHDQPAPPAVAHTGRSPARIGRRAVLGGGIALALVGGGYAAWRSGLVGGGASANSVAVLPFTNLSGDPSQKYFSDGLAAEVRAELARNNLLQVAAQVSSNRFADHTADAKSISNELGVAYLLDGNVRRSGDTVRVAAELIDGRTGFSRWSQSFDRSIADVFAVQSEIAGAVMAALSAQVANRSGDEPDGEGKRLEVGGTSNVGAYDAYLRGRDLFEQGSDATTDRAALALFDEAIAIDPQYGAAHAARSRAMSVIASQYAQGAERLALYDKSIVAAKKAVALAPRLADAHSALGYALFAGRLDVRAARSPYDRSRELGNGDADVLGRYALYSARTGRFAEARTAISRAATLDPLNPRVFRSVGAVEYAARRYAESIPPIERALVLNPRMGGAHAAIGASQLMLGQADEANRSFLAETNTLFGLPGIAIIARKQGRDAEADAAMARLVAEHGDNGLYQQAQVLAQWGDRAGALAVLSKARSTGDSGLILMRNDPLLDPLRKEPEFSRLLSDLGFD
jgi:TolB-like protein/tetratricopeptide (TPR) repeat protein